VTGFTQIDDERRWHEPSFVLPRARARNLRLSRNRHRRGNSEEYRSPEHDYDLQLERPALARQARNHKPGDPSRAVPLAFDVHGNVVESLRGRIPERQATQSRLLLEQGLTGKARRQAWCGLIARRRDCFSGNPEHKFYTPCLCGNRYCAVCGPKSFRNLFTRHSRLRPLVDKLLTHRLGDHRPRVMVKFDITKRNTGEMPSAERVRSFNQDIRRLFRLLEKRCGISRSDYGFLWCCEFGSGNTNLHAHGVYVGPVLSQKQNGTRHFISDLWGQVCDDGSKIVSVKLARNFEAALGHALKYPSKFFEAEPARLVELEVAFDRVRRVHALAAFYNPNLERDPGDEGPCDGIGHCPVCGDLLLDAPGYHFISDLRSEGRRDAEVVRIEVGRAKALAAESPP